MAARRALESFRAGQRALSGVLVSCALYALMRTLQISAVLGDGPFLDELLLCFGALSTLVAGAPDVSQRDLKRLLAYSTVENAGIVALALGFGGTLGLTAALVHVVAHASRNRPRSLRPGSCSVTGEALRSTRCAPCGKAAAGAAAARRARGCSARCRRSGCSSASSWSLRRRRCRSMGRARVRNRRHGALVCRALARRDRNRVGSPHARTPQRRRRLPARSDFGGLDGTRAGGYGRRRVLPWAAAGYGAAKRGLAAGKRCAVIDAVRRLSHSNSNRASPDTPPRPCRSAPTPPPTARTIFRDRRESDRPRLSARRIRTNPRNSRRRIPAFAWDEREMSFEHRVRFEDLPDMRPFRAEAGRMPAASRRRRGPRFVVGPVHAGIIEPGRFTFSSGGETVEHLDAQLGYSVSRGRACSRGEDAVAAAPRVARICGSVFRRRDRIVRSRARNARRRGRATRDATARASSLRELERIYNHLSISRGRSGAGYGLRQAHLSDSRSAPTRERSPSGIACSSMGSCRAASGSRFTRARATLDALNGAPTRERRARRCSATSRSSTLHGRGNPDPRDRAGLRRDRSRRRASGGTLDVRERPVRRLPLCRYASRARRGRRLARCAREGGRIVGPAPARARSPSSASETRRPRAGVDAFRKARRSG